MILSLDFFYSFCVCLSGCLSVSLLVFLSSCLCVSLAVNVSVVCVSLSVSLRMTLQPSINI